MNTASGRMKTLVGICAVIFIAAVSTSAATWTLDALVSEGLKNSPDIKSVAEEQNKAEAQVKSTKASAAPSVTVSANASHSIETMTKTAATPSVSTVGFDTGDYTMLNNVSSMFSGFADALSSKDNSLNAGVSLRQPLFSQGKVTIGLRVASLYSRQLLCKGEEAKMKVKASVTKAFYQALLAEQNEKIKDEMLKLAQETHRQTLVQYSVGKASELDTLRSRLGVESASSSLRDAQKTTVVVCESLVKTTGISEDPASIVLSGDFPAADYTISLADAQAAVDHNNKQLGQLQSGYQMYEEQVKLSKSDYLPLVFASANYTKLTSFNKVEDIEWGTDCKVGLGMTWNLNFSTPQNVKQSQASMRGFEQTQASAKNNIDVAVRSTWESMESARTNMMQAEGMVAMAQKASDISAKAYEVGRMTLLDMQRTVQDLESAKMAKNAALFQFHSAVIDLRVLMGDYLADAMPTRN